MKNNNTRSEKGSSLIGVAIMTIVLGLFMVAGIQLMKTYDVVEKDGETTNNTKEIQDALQNFASLEGRYPCPADITLAPDQANFGEEDCSLPTTPGRGGAAVLTGTIPVRTINSPDSMIMDGYNKRFVYAVTQNMTVATPTDPLNQKLGAIFLHDEIGNSVSSEDGHVSYALVSLGEDKRGAYDSQGVLLEPAPPTSQIAGQNLDGDSTFVVARSKQYRNEANDFTQNFAFQANPVAYNWVSTPWGNCNGICFSGTQDRTTACQDRQGVPAPNGAADCSHSLIPDVSRACSLGPCRWDIGGWGTCSSGGSGGSGGFGAFGRG